MPFTPVHPTAILPFLKLRQEGGWKAALVMGSIAPDLATLPYDGFRELSHSLLGGLLLDLPTAVVLAWLWHRFAQPRLRRMPGIPRGGSEPFGWAASLAGALVGVLTHLGWDLLTHDRSPLLERTGLYSMHLFDTPAGPFSAGQLSWYVNTALGAAILAAWGVSKARSLPGGPKAFLSGPWLRLVCLPPLPLLLVLGAIQPEHMNSLKDAFLDVIFSIGTIRRLLAACAVLGVGVFLWETRRETAPDTKA